MNAERRASVHLAAMLVLTFTTGIADAVGYLRLDKVFAGNMTGNVVILGMGASGTTSLPVLGPAIALAAFMAGAVLGGRVLRGRESGTWTWVTTLLLGLVGAAFAAAAVVLAVASVAKGTVSAFVLTAVLAGGMGLQAAVARRVAVQDVTTVVVTSTITGWAADSRLGGGTPAHPWPRRAGAVVLLIAGAAAGAALLTVSAALAVAVPAVLVVVVAVAGGYLSRVAGSPTGT